MKPTDKLKEIDKKIQSIREEADEHDENARQFRYMNNEKAAQYESGIAQGLRRAVLRIDLIT